MPVPNSRLTASSISVLEKDLAGRDPDIAANRFVIDALISLHIDAADNGGFGN